MEIILTILISNLVTLILWFFARNSVNAEYTEKVMTIKYSKRFMYSMIAIISGVPLILLLLLIIDIGIKNNSDAIGFALIFIFFFLIGVYLLLMLKKERVILSVNGITKLFVFRKPKEVIWENLWSIKYSFTGKYLIITNMDNSKIRISIAYDGFQDFCYMLIKLNIKSEYHNELILAANSNLFL